MIVVDASALVAILLREPGWEDFFHAILKAGGGMISPVNAWEASVRTVGLNDPAGRAQAQVVMTDLGVSIVPIDAEQTDIAVQARRRFGRKVLNMGDCFAYALAKTHGDGALLYKGTDFAQTDLIAVV